MKTKPSFILFAIISAFIALSAPLSTPAFGAWAVTGAPSGTSVDAKTATMTLPSFASGSGGNRLIVCGIGEGENTGIASVTFAGSESLTAVVSLVTTRGVHIYKLFNPTATGAQSVVVDWTGASTNSGMIACVALTGGDGNHDGTGTTGSGTGSPMSTSVTGSASGDMAIDVIYTTASGGGSSVTVDASQTSMYECDACLNVGSARNFGFSREESVGSSVSMDWTGVNISIWLHVGASFDSSGGATPTATPRRGQVF